MLDLTFFMPQHPDQDHVLDQELHRARHVEHDGAHIGRVRECARPRARLEVAESDLHVDHT